MKRILFSTTAGKDLLFRNEHGDKYGVLHDSVKKVVGEDLSCFSFDGDEVFQFVLSGNLSEDAQVLIEWGGWLTLMSQASEDVTWAADGF